MRAIRVFQVVEYFETGRKPVGGINDHGACQGGQWRERTGDDDADAPHEFSTL